MLDCRRKILVLCHNNNKKVVKHSVLVIIETIER